MIRIIKEGCYKRITCETCGAVLAYNEKEDLKMRTVGNVIKAFISTYIECPCCGCDIKCGDKKTTSYIKAEETDKYVIKGE